MCPKVTDEYKEERKIQILEGALESFAEKGYQATTIDDIARQIGGSKGSVYLYFSSKEEIYTQLLAHRMNSMIKNIKDQFDGIDSSTQKLQLLIRRFIQQPMDELRKVMSFYLEFWLQSSRNEQMQQIMQQYSEMAFALLTEILEEGQKNGEFRRDVDSKIISYLFWALRDGIALNFLGSGDETLYREQLKNMEEMILAYLKK